MNEIFTLTNSADLAESLEVKAATGAANSYAAALTQAINALPAKHREPITQAAVNAIKAVVHATATAKEARWALKIEAVKAALEEYRAAIEAHNKATKPVARNVPVGPPLAGAPAVVFEPGAFRIEFPGSLDVNLHRAEPQEIEITRDDQGRVSGAVSR